MSETSEFYRRTADGFARRLALVGPDQWGAGTPCTEWSIRDLVAHVLGEQLWIPPLVAGEIIEQVGDRFDGDQLGPDARATWSRAQSAVVETLDEPGAEERTVRLSYGPTSAGHYALEVTVDTLIHTWDLARAVGADESLPEDDVRRALDYFIPVAEQWRAGGAFGPEVVVPDDADAQTRLLGLVGRTA